MSKNRRSIGYIKELGEGKYLLRLSCGYDELGKRIQPSKTVHCLSSREAEKLLMDFYMERQRMAAQKSAIIPLTLEDLYTDWMDNHVKINLAKSTEKFYEDLWNGHLKQSGKLNTKTANPKGINKALSGIKGDKTKNSAFKMIKTMFNYGIKRGYYLNNPCNIMNTPKYRPKEKKVLTENEIKIVMNELPKEELKFQVIFYLAAICGMRRQEIVGMEWSSIDFKSESFKIVNNLKTYSSERTLYFPDGLASLLLRLMNEQNIQKQKLGDKWVEGDWVFTQWDGKNMERNTPTKWWKKFSNKIGINDVTFHGLRHTAATYMIKNNIPISTVSGILGHSQISTTLNVYTHTIEDTKKAAMNTMSNVFLGGRNKEAQ